MDNNIAGLFKTHAVSSWLSLEQSLQITEYAGYRDVGHGWLCQHGELTV